jgi:hypothetical protein
MQILKTLEKHIHVKYVETETFQHLILFLYKLVFVLTSLFHQAKELKNS